MSNPEELSLTSYAAVMAGLGAGLPLRRALELADVPEALWGPGAERWQHELEESAATDLEVVVSFDAALLEQQRRFAPVVHPIHADVAAWACFRRHFVTATDAPAFLAQRELSLGDYARLEADWLHRTSADESLAAALREAMSGPLGPCPTLTRTPSPLLADSPAPPPSTEPIPVIAESPSPGPALPAAPSLAAAPLALLTPSFTPPRAPSNETLGPWSVKPSVALPFGGAAPSAPAPGPATAPAAPRPAAPAGGTMLSLEKPESLPLPFSAAKPPGAPRLEARTMLAPPPDESEITAIPVSRKGPVMPFVAGAAAAPPPPRAPTPAPQPSGERTMLSAPALPDEPTLPFAPLSHRSPGAPPPAPEGLPIERFAVILAELESGGVPAEVLARHRLSTLAWSGLELVWRRRLAALPEEAERVTTLVRAVKERLAKR